MSGATLVTGAGGYLGKRLAERLDNPIVWTRANGDLTSNDPFASLDPRRIRRIVHGAAVTRFNVDAQTATAVNVEGTRKLLQFARKCDALESVDLLSTVYAVGLRDGVIAEEPSDDGAGFANEYERSKWEAEQLVLGEFDDLPWRIERIATVIADDDSGRVSQQNAVHNTLKLLYYGLLSLIPGTPDVPVYFVTADFVVDGILAAMDKGAMRSIFHVCHTREESLTLGGFLDTVFAVFERDEKFRARRALKPLFADLPSFELLVGQIQGFSGGILGQAVGSVAPFARELFSIKEFRNDRLMSLDGNLRAPDPEQLVVNVCQNLIDSRFGTVSA